MTANLGTVSWERLFKRLKKKASKRAHIANNHVSLEAGFPAPRTQLRKLTHKIKPDSNKPANRTAFVSGTNDIDYGKLRAILLEFLEVRADLERFLKTLKQPHLPDGTKQSSRRRWVVC